MEPLKILNKGKLCNFEGCKTQPIYNFEGKSGGKFCKEHKLDGMIDVKHKTCNFEGCKTRPNFNFAGETKGKFCNKHKLDRMIDVKNKTCNFKGCKTQPIYNFEGENKGKFCNEHKLDGMIDVINKTCNFEGCKTRPNYNFEGETKGKFCNEHKLDGMIDVKHKTCNFEGCKTLPSYNFKGETKRKFCNEHKLDGMIDIISKNCEFDGCKTRPSYNFEGENKVKFCNEHKLDGMINVKHKNCKTYLCSTLVGKKYEGYCLRCYINTFPDKPISRNYRTKEKVVVDFIIENFKDLNIVLDKTIQGGCSKRRPDILINLGHRIVIIEIDENQHIDYDCSCENKRIMEIYKDLEHRPIVFIRFNPDEYVNEKDEEIKSCWETDSKGIYKILKSNQKEWNLRLESLKNQIKYWIENESDKAIETVQLYYDC